MRILRIGFLFGFLRVSFENPQKKAGKKAALGENVPSYEKKERSNKKTKRPKNASAVYVFFLCGMSRRCSPKAHDGLGK